MKFVEKFRRATSSGYYIAEIDGLRFIAIISVVLFHLQSTMPIDYKIGNDTNFFIGKLYTLGWQGVELFFVISGFIIGLPFAKHYIAGEKKVVAKDYLYRRLTRLEPPYIIALLMSFGLHVFFNHLPVQQGLASFISSVFYLNFSINNDLNYLLIVSIWSLEIEIQFYLFALLFSKIFIPDVFWRRLSFVLIIIGFPILHQYFVPSPANLFTFFEFFALGFFIADLSLDTTKINLNNYLGAIIGLLGLSAILYVDYSQSIFNHYVYIISLFSFFYVVQNNHFWKKLIGNRYTSVIGGMCYSIYLLHGPLIFGIKKVFQFLINKGYYSPNIFINTLIALPIIIAFSAIYFLLFEKPFMNKNWPKNFNNRMKRLIGWNSNH